jgi:2',3'-cyclic-nucleotide 2'-phosphodiesterase/3'-nucleotidase
MNIKPHQLSKLIIVLLLTLYSCTGGKTRQIVILETTDVHGVILPYDFVERKEMNASLSGVANYLKKERKTFKDLILLDNGDNLQGQPEEYYFNFIDTLSPHFNSEVMNYLAYDGGTVGNHDIEAGHPVYDRVRKQYKFPLLAANAVEIKTGKPYFKPFTIINKEGVKIAVFGLVTPSIPNWLPPGLYSGMEFRDMLETAKLWMPLILNEKPDIVVGLFHSGWDKAYSENGTDKTMEENGSAAIAFKVPGFDVIFNGHDHSTVNEKIVNSNGDTVLILDGGSKSEKIGRADISISLKKVKGKRVKKITGSIINVRDFPPDPDFVTRFAGQDKIIRDYVNKEIGESATTITSRDAYFGSSSFVDMIHTMQLEISGAQISFAAPLSFDVSISKGPVTVGDMFKLYRFENMLYTMSLSGEEIVKYLEFSYSGWFNTMKSSKGYLMKFRTGKDGKPVLNGGKAWLKNQPYNFDSAAGIDYTVDVSKPEGKRITVRSLSDGSTFDPKKRYKVALNSYRGSGGGGHLTEGAGLSKDEIKTRLIASTDKDLRYYMIKWIESKKVINPQPLNNWKIIPETLVKTAIKRDRALLFGTE